MRRKKLNNKKKKKDDEVEEDFQDAQFYFIAGYTDGGSPYGITWEEAYADGLVEKELGMDSEVEYPF